jgi:hypothetical protein
VNVLFPQSKIQNPKSKIRNPQSPIPNRQVSDILECVAFRITCGGHPD